MNTEFYKDVIKECFPLSRLHLFINRMYKLKQP